MVSEPWLPARVRASSGWSRSRWWLRFRLRGRRCGPIVADFDLGAPDGIADRLRPLLGLLADYDLLFDPSFLCDNRLLGRCRYLDRALTERLCGRGCDIRRPVNRTAFNMNALLPQLHLLLYRLLDDVAAHPHTASSDFTFPDPQLLLVDRDNLFLMTGCTG